MSRFVVGDIHGCYDKLKTSLELAKFSSNDVLYAVGDYCDRGTQNLAVIEYLMSLKGRFKGCFGNHDIWIWQYLHPLTNNRPYMSRDVDSCWHLNRGNNTLKELSNLSESKKAEIFEWFSKLPYLIDLEDYIITHALLEEWLYNDLKDVNLTNLTIEECLENNYCVKDYDNWFWGRYIDKSLFLKDKFNVEEIKDIKKKLDDFYKRSSNTLYIIGHTPYLENSPNYNLETGVINLDCASFASKDKYGKEGAVCIMNLDTKEWFKSDGTIGVIK